MSAISKIVGDMNRMLSPCACIVLAGMCGTAEAASPLPSPSLDDGSLAVASSPLVAVKGIASTGDIAVKLELDANRLDQFRNKSAVVMTDFVLAPMAAGAPPMVATLDLEPIEVFGPDTQFFVGSMAGRGHDRLLPLPDVQMFGGTVRGVPDSTVFLSLSAEATNGYVRLGNRMQVISSGRPDAPNGIYIFDPKSLPVGTIHWSDFVCETVTDSLPVPVIPLEKATQPCRQVLLAIETDYEFTANLFGGNDTNASAYITTLIGAVSQIYISAVNAHFQLGLVRLWDDSNDPWTASSSSSQLSQFRDYWTSNMSGVPRNLAHFLSGRSLGGGVAYLNAICGDTNGYGLSGNLHGSFPYPIQNNNSQNWDLNVTAHEIGHNFGAIHTHNYCPPVDQCPPSQYWGQCQTAQVCITTGTLMSYCHLCPGGEANLLMQFHPTSIQSIVNYLDSLSPTSCNIACNGLSVAISSPTNNSSAMSGNPVTFTGSAFDSGAGNLRDTLNWTSDVQGVIGHGASFSRNDLSEATHIITAQCSNQGNTASATISLTIIPQLNSPPAVTISSPPNNSSSTVGSPVSFNGSAIDAQSGNLSSSITWTSNLQGQFGSGASVTTSNLSVGAHTITARCTDPGGLLGTASINITVMPGGGPNSPPSIVINGPANGTTFLAGKRVKFIGTANDTQDGNVSALINWSSNVQGFLGTGATITRSDLALGPHTITALITDSGGMFASASINITISLGPTSDRRATADVILSGVVTGNFIYTQSNNGVYESIREVKSTGPPGQRYSMLKHRWSFSIPTTGTTRTFWLKAYHTPSVDFDDFVFEYSLNDGSYLPMVTVTKTEDDGIYQTFTLPGNLYGTVYVQVKDTDRTPGNTSMDTIYVDDMFIRVQ